MKKILFPLFFTICGFINAQNFIIKEALFNEPNSSIINCYFKNGFKVVLKNLHNVYQGQVIEMSTACDSLKLLDSFYYHQGAGFVFFEQNANLFYERIAENKNNNRIYLIRRNLSLNTVDSIFIKQTNHYGVYNSKIKKYKDTTVIQLLYADSINVNDRYQVNDFYVVKNNAITNTFTKSTGNLLSSALTDFYLIDNKIFITCNYSAYKLALYVHDLSTNSVDSVVNNSYKPVNNILSPIFKFNYIKINQKLYLINAYCTSVGNKYDSIVLIDIGNGTNLNKIKVYAANGDYFFISDDLMQDYFITGQPKDAIINKIETGLSFVPLLMFNKSLNNKLLEHEYYFENADTQYVCGIRYDSSVIYATIEKIYHAKTGILNNQIQNPTQINIYPNPARQHVNISLLNTPSELISTNILGQQFPLYKTELGYDISSLEDGLYFIGFTIENKSYNVRIWVKK